MTRVSLLSQTHQTNVSRVSPRNMTIRDYKHYHLTNAFLALQIKMAETLVSKSQEKQLWQAAFCPERMPLNVESRRAMLSSNSSRVSWRALACSRWHPRKCAPYRSEYVFGSRADRAIITLVRAFQGRHRRDLGWSTASN
jgi:hypothetical protein